MAFKNKLLLIEQSQKKIKSDRESIKKLGQTKKRNRNILHNITNSIRMELDTSPYQTIVTPGGLWIDYEPDLKKGKVEKFYNERVNEPFSKKYVKPDKEVMQLFMDDEFKVKLNEIHMATIEFTKFKEKDINEPDEGEGGEFGNGIGRDWDGNLSKPPAKGIIQARYYETTAVPEKIWNTHYGYRINIFDDAGKSYFVEWDTYKGLHRRIIEDNSESSTQYLIQDYTYSWIKSIEKNGFDAVSEINGIPLKNIKLYSEKDHDDIVYDGPPDRFL